MWGAGNALIRLWLLGVNHSALKGDPWPYNRIIFVLVSGVFLVLGLVAIPSIAHGCTSVGSLPALCASYRSAYVALTDPSAICERAALCVQRNKIFFFIVCLLYTSPSPRDGLLSRMPSSA